MNKIQSCFHIISGADYCRINFLDDGQHGGHKLKPCPFCGSRVLAINNMDSPEYWVECENCCAECPGDINEKGSCATETEALETHNRALLSAVTAWNRRR